MTVYIAVPDCLSHWLQYSALPCGQIRLDLELLASAPDRSSSALCKHNDVSEAQQGLACGESDVSEAQPGLTCSDLSLAQHRTICRHSAITSAQQGFIMQAQRVCQGRIGSTNSMTCRIMRRRCTCIIHVCIRNWRCCELTNCMSLETRLTYLLQSKMRLDM